VLDQKVTRTFPTGPFITAGRFDGLPRDRVTCPHRQFVVLVDRQPAGARDRFRVSRQMAIAVGHEPQPAAQRSSDIQGLQAQPSLKADIDHKERFPVVTNPAAPGAIAGAPVSDSADSAAPSRPLADAFRAMLADAARRQRGPK
jgi:hypothetical protein